jgi:hypothetical protein
MAAVLARRILQDLLKRCAGLDNYILSNAIASFVKDNRYPVRPRENLGYLREIGDRSAHALPADTEGKILEEQRKRSNGN